MSRDRIGVLRDVGPSDDALRRSSSRPMIFRVVANRFGAATKEMEEVEIR
jgi:hypothetical protein